MPSSHANELVNAPQVPEHTANGVWIYESVDGGNFAKNWADSTKRYGIYGKLKFWPVSCAEDLQAAFAYVRADFRRCFIQGQPYSEEEAAKRDTGVWPETHPLRGQPMYRPGLVRRSGKYFYPAPSIVFWLDADGHKLKGLHPGVDRTTLAELVCRMLENTPIDLMSDADVVVSLSGSMGNPDKEPDEMRCHLGYVKKLPTVLEADEALAEQITAQGFKVDTSIYTPGHVIIESDPNTCGAPDPYAGMRMLDVIKGDTRTVELACVPFTVRNKTARNNINNKEFKPHWDFFFHPDGRARTEEERQQILDDLLAVVKQMNSDVPYAEWLPVMMALRTLPDDLGRAIALAYCMNAPHRLDDDVFEDGGFWDGLEATETHWRNVFVLGEAQEIPNPAKGRPKAIDLTAVGFAQGIPATVDSASSPATVQEVYKALGALAGTGGKKPASMYPLQQALKLIGAHVTYDRFLQQLLIRWACSPIGSHIHPIAEADEVMLRMLLTEFGGFKEISAERMREVLLIEGIANQSDQLTDWVESRTWDGVPRVDTFFARYFGTADTPYTRALGRYTWTMLAGRAVSPGCKADIVPWLVGAQGRGKSTALKAMAPEHELFLEVALDEDDTKVLNKLPGKCVVEIGEGAGMSRKTQESYKAFVACTVDVWRRPYDRKPTSMPRRCGLFVTTNEPESLADSTGERRAAPVTVERPTDPEAIRRDIDQLWAEGLAMYRQSGVAWQDVERLARAEHAAYKVSDPWTDPIVTWLDAHPERQHVSAADLLQFPLGLHAQHQNRGAQLRVGNILRTLGWERKTVRQGSGTASRFIRPAVV